MILRAGPLPLPFAGACRRLRKVSGRLVHLGIVAAAMMFVASTAKAQGQEATIQGTVKDASTGAGIPDVNVRIPNTPIGILSDTAGHFILKKVPFGIVSITATRLGWGEGSVTDLNVNKAVVEQDITMSETALALTAMTSTASVDPISGINAPYMTATVPHDLMPVPTVTAISGLVQGKVAGVNIVRADGSPGQGSYIQIRSISSPFEGNTPLFVIDGVPLNEGQNVTTGDIDGMDVESIEVIKGAAAAALYGSRAAGGVIAITTHRGDDISLGKSQLQLRGDYGQEAPGFLPPRRSHHYYQVNALNQWTDLNGNVVPKLNRVTSTTGYLQNDYTKTWDPVTQYYIPDKNYNLNAQLSQNSASSNFNLSFSRTHDPGTVRLIDGQTQNTARFNINHQLRDNLSVDLGLSHTRTSLQQPLSSFGSIAPLDPDVNLLAPDPAGISRYILAPDSGSTSSSNPLYLSTVENNWSFRMATGLNISAEFRPTNWLRVQAVFGYDKRDDNGSSWTPPYIPTNDGGSLTSGTLQYSEGSTDGKNGKLVVSAQHDFGALTTHLGLQGDLTDETDLSYSVSGVNYTAAGAENIGSATTRSGGSSSETTRLTGGNADLQLDYSGKYIGDFLYRREGNSLFGQGHQWNGFYRMSGGWLMTQESWWPSALKDVTTFKPRLSYGITGNQPEYGQSQNLVSTYSAGFEWITGGNSRLQPELKHETEAGFDAVIASRLSVSFSYVYQTTTNDITEIPDPDITGFEAFWQNVGQTAGHTWELQVQGDAIHNAQIFNKPFNWNINLTADHSVSWFPHLGRTCYFDAPLYVCDNTSQTAWYGSFIMRNKNQLAPSRDTTPNAWQVDNLGFLVPTGCQASGPQSGSGCLPITIASGVANNLWGTHVTIDNVSYTWGEPTLQWSDTAKNFNGDIMVKNAVSFANLGLGSTFNWGNFSVFLQFVGQVGGKIYNNYFQNQVSTNDDPVADMTNVPDSLKKPYYYFTGSQIGQGMDAENGAGLPAQAEFQDYYVDNDTFVKLTEADFSYQMDARAHPILNKMGASRLVFQLVGHNLLTLTGYKGEDPEAAGFTGTNGTQFAEDNYRYPFSRSVQGSIMVVF